jgi:hypothetical protein
LFQKIKAGGGFAFKAFNCHFLFQSWCLGEKKIFQVLEFREFGTAERGNNFLVVFSLYIFGRPCPKPTLARTAPRNSHLLKISIIIKI